MLQAVPTVLNEGKRRLDRIVVHCHPVKLPVITPWMKGFDQAGDIRMAVQDSCQRRGTGPGQPIDNEAVCFGSQDLSPFRALAMTETGLSDANQRLWNFHGVYTKSHTKE